MEFQPFSGKQLAVMGWWKRREWESLDGIICDGAVRSGKTLAMTLGFFLWSMSAFDNQVFGICGKTIGALRRNIIIHLPQWLSFCRITESRSENRLTVTCGHRQNTYYLFGGQDEGAAQLIQGITLAGVFLDEAALMPRSFLEQACARCSVTGSKLWMSCNPEGPEHWFYQGWILAAEEKNLLRIPFSMEDNPGLSDKIRQRYHRLYQGVFYRRYVLGQWCATEGLVYDFDPERHVTTEFDNFREAALPDRRFDKFRQDPPKFYISVDYGTRNPFSAGLWRVGDGVACRVAEFYHDGRKSGQNLTDEAYCDALEALAAGLPIEAVVIDPSAASMIAALRRRGKFSVRKAKNSVLPGIRLVQSLLLGNVLKFSPRCQNTIREFALYSWDEGDKPRKDQDHAMDDIRYFCMTVLRRQLHSLPA